MAEISNPGPEQEKTPAAVVRPERRTRFPWISTIIALTIIILAGLVVMLLIKAGQGAKSLADKGIAVIDKTVEKAPEIARNFRTGNISETFRASIPQISATGGDVLELAVSTSDELIRRTDERRIAWDRIYLGTTAVEIRVPVTFRYHVLLSDKWMLASRSNVCLVLAPPIRPSLPPAIHTEGMETRAESGWARFDKDEQLEKLQAELTSLLKHRAMDPAHSRLVREECRKSVATFVKNWLLREAHWRSDRFTAIIVRFPDEVSATSDEALLRVNAQPTLQLETVDSIGLDRE